MVVSSANDEGETSSETFTAPNSVVLGSLPMSSDQGVEEVTRQSNNEDDEQKHREKGDGDENVDEASCSNSATLQESVLLSPSFRSAAALAGWDAEAILQAALNQSPFGSGGHSILTTQDVSEISCGARKRDKRTPLSSARRQRRVQWEGGNGSPLGRLPMKPLSLLSDNENSPKKDHRCKPHRRPVLSSDAHSGAEEKENFNPEPSAGKEENGFKGKEKEDSPTKPPCLDQLREELSCAVCLDICFEPSTISCGHSFCGACLKSVLEKCGHRCPKCRQPLRSEALKNCRINTVLWNTIQILFPKESAARLQEQKCVRDEEAAKRASLEQEQRSRSSLGTRPARLQPWRSSPYFTTVNRIGVLGNLRSSFQSASELMMSSRRGEDDSISQQFVPTTWSGGEVRERQSGSHSQVATTRVQRNQSRTRRQIRASQEQVDAALAARLQEAEIDTASDPELLIVESPTAARTHSTTRPRYGTVALAAANLRNVASRAVRQHRSRTRS